MCIVSGAIEEVINSVPKAKLTSVEGINLLSRLIARAERSFC